MDVDPEAAEAVAARRYWTLQFTRLAGIFTTFTGAMFVVGRIDAGDAGAIIGPALFVAGPLLFFVAPVLLARKWKREHP